jgi:hypothetical protein
MVNTDFLRQDASSHKGDSAFVKEYVNEDVEELVEVMHHWSTREAFVFCEHSPALKDGTAEGNAINSSSSIGQQTRNRVVYLLHVLLSTSRAADHLPMALTLFDAFCVKHSSGLSILPVTSAAVLIAIARITLITSGEVSEEDFSQVEDLAMELEAYGETPVTAKEVAVAEVDVIRALDGRIKLSSPTEWARAMVQHLGALGAPKKGLDQALPKIVDWAAHLIQQAATTPSLPPEKLGCLACIIGLLNAGMLKAEELRPQELTEADWEDTLIMQLVHMFDDAADQQRQQDNFISINLLSRIFNCGIGELRQMTLNLSSVLRIHLGMR